MPDQAAATGPIFVVGMNGSGTTMLADSLGQHPRLFTFPLESKLIPHYIQRTHAAGALSPQGARQLADEIGRAKPFWQANKKQPLRLGPEVQIPTDVGGVFDALFGDMARRAGKPRWIEKSPVNTEHITLLAETFPQARFLHIIRDGRDAAQSFHRRWGFDPAHTVWRWKKTVALGREQGARLGPQRYMELSYEALTGDPATHMQAVCEFVGEHFDASVLRSSMRHMTPQDKAARGGQIVANSQKWRQYFSPEQVLRLERLAGRELQSLGYEVAEAGDADLGDGERRWLRQKDRVARSVAYFREYGWRGLPMFLRLLKSASGQARTRRF